MLTQQARSELGPLSESAQFATTSAAIAALQVGDTAEQFSITAAELNQLIGENRGLLVDTLSNVQAASLQLRSAADVLGPTLQSGELVGDLEALVSNASAASEDLQSITSSLNTPANLVLLQQTLESARDALSSAQKVMADVDEITGDPEVRQQIRNLIMGLGSLVSSTQTLEQQSQVAQSLVPLGVASSQPNGEATAWDASPLSLPDYRLSEYGFSDSPVSALPPTTGTSLTFPELTITSPASRSSPSLNSESAPLSRYHQPALFFDGERYVLRPTQQLAESAHPAIKASPQQRQHADD